MFQLKPSPPGDSLLSEAWRAQQFTEAVGRVCRGWKAPCRLVPFACLVSDAPNSFCFDQKQEQRKLLTERTRSENCKTESKCEMKTFLFTSGEKSVSDSWLQETNCDLAVQLPGSGAVDLESFAVTCTASGVDSCGPSGHSL